MCGCDTGYVCPRCTELEEARDGFGLKQREDEPDLPYTALEPWTSFEAAA